MPVNKLFPYQTFIVNIIGSFLIGCLSGLLIKNSITNDQWKFLATGVCGGFTTFSAFSLEGFELLQQHRYTIFILYFLLSITTGLVAVWLGYLITK
jgi:CrcB protein